MSKNKIPNSHVVPLRSQFPEGETSLRQLLHATQEALKRGLTEHGIRFTQDDLSRIAFLDTLFAPTSSTFSNSSPPTSDAAPAFSLDFSTNNNSSRLSSTSSPGLGVDLNADDSDVNMFDSPSPLARENPPAIKPSAAATTKSKETSLPLTRTPPFSSGSLDSLAKKQRNLGESTFSKFPINNNTSPKTSLKTIASQQIVDISSDSEVEDSEITFMPPPPKSKQHILKKEDAEEFLYPRADSCKSSKQIAVSSDEEFEFISRSQTQAEQDFSMKHGLMSKLSSARTASSLFGGASKPAASSTTTTTTTSLTRKPSTVKSSPPTASRFQKSKEFVDTALDRMQTRLKTEKPFGTGLDRSPFARTRLSSDRLKSPTSDTTTSTFSRSSSGLPPSTPPASAGGSSASTRKDWTPGSKIQSDELRARFINAIESGAVAMGEIGALEEMLVSSPELADMIFESMERSTPRGGGSGGGATFSTAAFSTSPRYSTRSSSSAGGKETEDLLYDHLIAQRLQEELDQAEAARFMREEQSRARVSAYQPLSSFGGSFRGASMPFGGGVPRSAFGRPSTDSMSYEDWAKYCEENDVKVGVPKRELNSLPVTKYSCARPLDPPECVICKCEYSDGEELRRLPCFHSYHKDCIDTWLSKSKKCPTCLEDVHM